MKTADLYIRVSTEEQADKGYSQRSQQENLERHCEKAGIKIGKIILEDHSAKTFDRPAWSGMLRRLKEAKRDRPDFIFFTKWDRFSRNAGDAYQMLNILKRLGVEPQAVEQPLDLAVPENKMMLAIYLAAPEVENDRRALNVIYGMRRARKEGRYMGVAPLGYANKVTEKGLKFIAPKYPEAEIMKWVFEEIEKGLYSGGQILKMANRKGLKCSRSSFFVALRNPVYCGKILVPAFQEEEACLVQGQHEALISERLFLRVQDILDGKKGALGTKVLTPSPLSLRGFLCCPNCTRMLTGSASKGRSGHYYYYHCHAECGVRFKAEVVNDAFEHELRKYQLKPETAKLFRMVIKDVFASEGKQQVDERKDIIKKIEQQENLLSVARRKLLMDEIDSDDFKQIKKDCKENLSRLEARLLDLPVKEKKKSGQPLNNLLENVVSTFSRLDILYKQATVEQRRELIGSIYPENLTFDGQEHRTARLNEAVELMFLINSELNHEKSRTNSGNLKMSGLVPRAGVEPAHP